MSLRETLYNKMSRPYLDATLKNTTSDNQTLRDDWVQFVRDHLPWLKARSMIYNVTESVMPNVRYNLLRYMRDKGIETQLWWVVLEINGFRNDMDFNKNLYPRDDEDNESVYMRIYLPPTEEVTELYHRWATSATLSKSSTLANNI